MNFLLHAQNLSFSHPHYKFILLTILFSAFLCSPFVWAQERPSVEEALEQLGTALQNDESISPELRKALGGLVEALKNERAETPTPPEPKEISQEDVAPAVDEYLETKGESGMKPGLLRFTDKLDVFGDTRLRYENSFNQDEGRRNRTRVRARLRLGGNYQLTDDLVFGARLITGDSDDPNSPHHTFGTAFDSLEVSLDRVFLTYTPHQIEGLKVTAGKFGHSFYSNPVFSELVWDADVQPEGLVTTYRIGDKGRLENFDITGGYYVLLEQGGGDDAYIAVVQAAGQVRLADSLKANMAVGFYYYDDVSPSGSSTLLADNSGNQTVDLDDDGSQDDFRSDFRILNPIVALTYDGWKYPLTWSGEYIENFGGEGGEDSGWALGLAMGNTKKKGDWRVYYQYQLVEQDAVFSAFVQDDFLFATNHRSHVFGGKYQFTDSIQLHLWALISERDTLALGQSDREQWRTRADLNIKF